MAIVSHKIPYTRTLNAVQILTVFIAFLLLDTEIRLI